jgi:hypothetical protein
MPFLLQTKAALQELKNSESSSGLSPARLLSLHSHVVLEDCAYRLSNSLKLCDLRPFVPHKFAGTLNAELPLKKVDGHLNSACRNYRGSRMQVRLKYLPECHNVLTGRETARLTRSTGGSVS